MVDKKFRYAMLDGVVLENYRMVEHGQHPVLIGSTYFETAIPSDFEPGYVDGEIYEAYVGNCQYGGLIRKCSDTALFVEHPNLGWSAIAATRGPKNSFPNKLWIGGGAPQKGINQIEWTLAKAVKEFGLQSEMLDLFVLFGTYTTSSIWPDTNDRCKFAITTQECYGAVVKDYRYLEQARGDEDHQDEIKLLTLADLRNWDPDRFHWYPHRVWTLGLLLLEGEYEEVEDMLDNPAIPQ